MKHTAELTTDNKAITIASIIEPNWPIINGLVGRLPCEDRQSLLDAASVFRACVPICHFVDLMREGDKEGRLTIPPEISERTVVSPAGVEFTEVSLPEGGRMVFPSEMREMLNKAGVIE